MALFSRGSHHKPKKREIPFSNEVPFTSQKKARKSRFQIEDIGIIFQKSPKRHGNPVFKWGSHHKPRKNTEIPFSNRRYWHYFPEVPITSQIKQRKSRFQIEEIGIIFQTFPSQAQKREIPFSNRRYWHYFPEKPKKTRKSRFQMRFPSQAKKNTEIPFSNRRYWHYFPEKPKKTRKSRFQMRFPSQAQKKARKFRFQIEDIDIIFQRLPSHKPKKTTEIPFSNRSYWHYFPEVPITSPKEGTSRFQIEDIGIIFQKSPKRHGNPVFKWGSHHKPKKREIPFSNRRYWHYFPEKPKKTRKSRFQKRFPSQAQKKHGNSVFK